MRHDIVFDMNQSLPTTATTGYDGPAQVAEFLATHHGVGAECAGTLRSGESVLVLAASKY